MIGWRTCGEGWTGSTGGATWITDYWPQVVPACEARRPPSAMEEEVAGYDQLRIWMVYVRAAYWGVATMSSLGYAARLTAHTETEMVFAIFVQVLGACLNAAIFSNVATVINRGDAASTRYTSQLDRINEFIRFHRLPLAIRNKLHGYHDLLFSINRGFDLQQIAAIFPRNVQARASAHPPAARLGRCTTARVLRPPPDASPAHPTAVAIGRVARAHRRTPSSSCTNT